MTLTFPKRFCALFISIGFVILFSLLLSAPLFAATLLVTSTDGDVGTGTLGEALQLAEDGDVIDCSPIAGQTIFIGNQFPAIGRNLTLPTSSLTILGNGVILDAGSAHSVLSLASGSVTMTGFTLQNGLSEGGDGGFGLTGGGGGAGGGGGLYLHAGTTMSISTTTLNDNQATGGAGGAGTGTGSGGGGGGFGGGNGGFANRTPNFGAGGGGGGNNGGTVGGRDGGVGTPNTFSNFGGSGGGGENSGVANARAGGSNAASPTTPAHSGGSGGVGNPTYGAGAGGGAGSNGSGGNGTSSTISAGGVGGSGGIGFGDGNTYGAGGGGGGGNGGGAGVGASGGGGGWAGPGGGGGAYGGGGGAGGTTTSGGNGGFGAGSGAGGTSGSAGFGGGAGGGGVSGGGGGGGMGAGGAIFVHSGATLNIESASISGSIVTAGAGGSASSVSGQNGSALGRDLFLVSGGNINFNLTSDLSIDAIGGNYSQGGFVSTGSSGVTVNNSPGITLTFATPAGQSAYEGLFDGVLNLNGGILSVDSDYGLGYATVEPSFNGGTLATTDSFTSARNFSLESSGGTFQPATGTTLTLSGVVSGSGALILNGAGTLVPSNTNTYGGETTLHAGTLSIASEDNIGGPNAALTLNGGIFSVTGDLSTSGAIAVTGNSQISTASGKTSSFTGTLTGADAVTLTLSGSGTNSFSTVNVDSGTFTIAGALGEGQTLTKNGSGILSLPSNNSAFTENVTVVGGNLKINGTLGSLVTVNPGATLSGTGAVGSIRNSGILSPGNSIGTLSSGPVIFTGESTYKVELNPTTSTLLNVTGSVALGGTLEITQDAGSYGLSGEYTIMNATGGMSGTFSSIILHVISGYDFSVSVEGDKVLLSYIGPGGGPLSGGCSLHASSSFPNDFVFLCGWIFILSCYRLRKKFHELMGL